MLSFVCSSIACVQMYLGVGYVNLFIGNTLIYTAYFKDKTYVCNVVADNYQCELKN